MRPLPVSAEHAQTDNQSGNGNKTHDVQAETEPNNSERRIKLIKKHSMKGETNINTVVSEYNEDRLL